MPPTDVAAWITEWPEPLRERVESAWRSGIALAGRILGTEAADARPAEPRESRQGELWVENS